MNTAQLELETLHFVGDVLHLYPRTAEFRVDIHRDLKKGTASAVHGEMLFERSDPRCFGREVMPTSRSLTDHFILNYKLGLQYLKWGWGADFGEMPTDKEAREALGVLPPHFPGAAAGMNAVGGAGEAQ